jgi:hypothetical protein
VAAAVPAAAPVAGRPAWRWRTFPVYFAFAVGMFGGSYLGYAAGVASDRGNETFWIVVIITAASLLGFGLARISSRVMISRGWVKPRAVRK